NDPVPAHHEFSHLVAVGGESNYFGRYGHEGTGVKPRGFNPFGSMQTNTYTVALRKKPGDLYNTFWCYFLDPLSGHWELYGCGKKLNSDGQNEYIKTTGGFVEVVGPPNNARTGHRVREVEFRGWRMQTDGSWNVIDRMDAAYNSATSLSNKEWAVNASGDKFVMRMGGFKDSAPDPGILSLPNPPVLPDYLQGESLQELFQMPADFFVLSPENVTDTAVLLRYELQNFGTNPQIMLYYGTEYGLTEGIHADRLIDEIWQEELSVPESWIQQGILEIPLGGLTNATDYYYRLRIENEEGITWSMDTDHFETAAFHNNPPVAVDDSAVTDKNTAVEVEVLANDSDADLDELSVESFTQPANGSTSASPDGSTITYTPDTGFSGVDTFDYVVTDGTDVDTGAVVITINNTHTETGLFVRGDSNGGGGIDVADAVHILFGLYGGLSRDCEDAQDVNDDGSVDLSDAVTLLNHLFLAMPHPPNPFPETGTDPTPDGLGCERM
ncbi:MAG: Ig-like domain-containing protein, partial [Pirellulales bacterium]|nr:Ig-like domain-containing protein [Pirellulales bacterium]